MLVRGELRWRGHWVGVGLGAHQRIDRQDRAEDDADDADPLRDAQVGAELATFVHSDDFFEESQNSVD